MIRRMRDAAFVVLDDIGTATQSDVKILTTLEIINARIGRPTIITTNLDMHQIGQIYDDRIVSRLRAGVCIEMNGRDRRLG